MPATPGAQCQTVFRNGARGAVGVVITLCGAGLVKTSSFVVALRRPTLKEAEEILDSTISWAVFLTFRKIPTFFPHACFVLILVTFIFASALASYGVPGLCQMAGVASTVFTSTWIGRELFALGRKMASQPGTMTPRKHIKKRTKRASPSPATSHRVESEYSNGDVSCSCSDNEYDYHEKVVDDINLRFFYQPRTLTLLFCIVVLLVYFAFVRWGSICIARNGLPTQWAHRDLVSLLMTSYFFLFFFFFQKNISNDLSSTTSVEPICFLQRWQCVTGEQRLCWSSLRSLLVHTCQPALFPQRWVVGPWHCAISNVWGPWTMKWRWPLQLCVLVPVVGKWESVTV